MAGCAARLVASDAAELIVAMGDGSHASWIENFPWTRLAGVELPAEAKPVHALQQSAA